MMAPLSSGGVNVVFLHVLQRKIACRRRNRSEHRGEQKSSTSRRERLRKPKQPIPRDRFVCLFGSFLCIDGTTMMQ